MPSIFGHAVVGAAAAQMTPRPKRPRLFWILSILCSVLPDIDVLSFAFGVSYDSFFGHRGFFHSIVFAFIAGFLGSSVYLKSIKIKSKAEIKLLIYFFLVTLTHPILDAMTTRGHGVAYFSPWNWHRYFYWYRPIYVSPLSVSEFFNNTGIRIIFREALFILLPCVFLLSLKKLSDRTLSFKKLLSPDRVFFGAMIISFVIAFFVFPLGLLREELIPGINGINVYQIDAALLKEKRNSIDSIPLEDLPGKKLLVNYKDLVKNGLFNTVLIPARQPWSGAFFPTWLGGVSGRWQDPYLLRIWKTLAGDPSVSKPELVDLLHSAAAGTSEKSLQAVDQLGPTEKYDAAVGDYYLASTRFESSVRGRGLLDTFPNAPFWAGYCNSISLAAIYEKEPKKAVRVLNPDGYDVKFYPNDIKALLGISYMFTYPKSWDIGNRCELDGPKSEACLDVNPAALVIALTNLIGLARTSFLIDKEPFLGIQNAPIRKAEVRVINPPYFTGERQHYFQVQDLIVKWLMDVEIHLTLSKITPLDPTGEEEDVTYRATLGLDQSQNLVGGRWEDPFNHPDFAWGGGSISTVPGQVDHQLTGNRSIEWPILKELVEESSKSTPQNHPIEILKIIQTPISHGFAFNSEADAIGGGISYLRLSDPVEIYGRLEGKRREEFKSVDLVALGNPSLSPSQMPLLQEPSSHPLQEWKLASEVLKPRPGSDRIYYRLKAPGSIENRDGLVLRFNKASNSGFVQFQLPFKQRFPTLLKPGEVR